MPAKKKPKSRYPGTARSLSDVRAILASDIHLCGRAPVARSGEPDWFAAMARPLGQLRTLADKHSCPILYAGDIFDRWNASAEVINFAMEHLPPGYAVPGQHDLPNHNYGEIERTAYWTLCKAEVLKNLKPGEATWVGKLRVTGFPWGFEPTPAPSDDHADLHVAVIHRFIYTDAKLNGYPGVGAGARVSVCRAALVGYDAAAYGDNHKGFIDSRNAKRANICNCGGFMRRKVDERDYRPGVGLLLRNGEVVRHYFDTSGEVFTEQTEAEEQVGKILNMDAFMGGLKSLDADDSLEFVTALRKFLKDNDTEHSVEKIVLEAATE